MNHGTYVFCALLLFVCKIFALCSIHSDSYVFLRIFAFLYLPLSVIPSFFFSFHMLLRSCVYGCTFISTKYTLIASSNERESHAHKCRTVSLDFVLDLYVRSVCVSEMSIWTNRSCCHQYLYVIHIRGEWSSRWMTSSKSFISGNTDRIWQYFYALQRWHLCQDKRNIQIIHSKGFQKLFKNEWEYGTLSTHFALLF